MEQLDKFIDIQKAQLPEEAKSLLAKDELEEVSKYPFNQYTNIFSILLKKGTLSYEGYTQARDEYFKRNPNLDKFEMAPRTFGQTWGENWLKEKYQGKLINPPHQKGYKSEFDLWLPYSGNGIKVEVKASHVADEESNQPLVQKAQKKPKGTEESVLAEIEKIHFKMNFQQLKPKFCDVFVWIAVWLDDIDVWVIPSSKIKLKTIETPKLRPKESIVREGGVIYMTNQHRGAKNSDVDEGQIFVSNLHYKDLNLYKVKLDEIIDKIKAAYESGT